MARSLAEQGSLDTLLAADQASFTNLAPPSLISVVTLYSLNKSWMIVQPLGVMKKALFCSNPHTNTM